MDEEIYNLPINGWKLITIYVQMLKISKIHCNTNAQTDTNWYVLFF